MLTVAILQSNYIPWKGYFDLIASVDVFAFYDDVQFTINDWRNRNQIKTPHGPQWLSIPVGQRIDRTIREVKLPANAWQRKHWRALEMSYGRAPYFRETAAWLAPLYLDHDFDNLAELNRTFTRRICAELAITTRLVGSESYDIHGGRSGRVLDLCLQLGATRYLSGPSAKAYLDVGLFNHAGVEVEWMDYSGYPPYAQMWGPFVHAVSVVDLLFHCGPDARKYMKAGTDRFR